MADLQEAVAAEAEVEVGKSICIETIRLYQLNCLPRWMVNILRGLLLHLMHMPDHLDLLHSTNTNKHILICYDILHRNYSGVEC